MSDNHNRYSRGTDPYARPPSAAAQRAAGTDPLAELARLIGQNNAAADAVRQSVPRDARYAEERPAAWEQHPDPAGASNDPYYDDRYADPRERYAQDPQAPGAPRYGYQDAQGYEGDPYRDMPPEEEHLYEDAVPQPRRSRLFVIVAALAVVLVTSAGVLGYRAIFGKSSKTGTPPVIKAEAAPTKVVPTTTITDSNSKLIYDRVGDRNQTERVVAREEQPVDVKDASRPAPRNVMTNPTPVPPAAQPKSPQGASALAPAAAPAAAPATAAGPSEPKRIRTVTIKPDQQNGSDSNPIMAAATAAVPPAAAATPSAPPRAAAPLNTGATGTQVASAAPVDASPSLSSTRRVAPKAAPQPDPNAPMSLSPPGNAAPAPAPAARAPATMRTASVPPAAAVASSGAAGSYVQVSSQRSEAEAQAAFRSLQTKFPSILGDRQAVIRRADLGDKGTYYRAQVGPFTKLEDATGLCSNLKAAGGQCVVQRN